MKVLPEGPAAWLHGSTVEDTRVVEPVKLVEMYEAGVLTRHELLLRLCQVAADRAPANIVAELPADVLAEVREWSATPPTSPDHCRVFGSVCAGPDFDEEAHFREESRRLYDGLWRWHRHFADAEPDTGATRGR